MNYKYYFNNGKFFFMKISNLNKSEQDNTGH